MIWTTWRQHRAELAVGTTILAALAAAMVVVGELARTRSSGLGLPRCLNQNGDCGAALDALHRDFHTIPPFTAALVAIPLLAGMFWAAPLVSREYEAGTHRLAWTQSMSPLRWITVKLALIFGVLAAAALGLGLLATWTLDPLESAFGGRYNSSWYDIQGVVPVACMLFALAVGVAISATMRRTIPAMAATLFVYAAARIPIHWIRPNFAQFQTRTVTLPMTVLLDDATGAPQDLAPAIPPGALLHSVKVSDASGHALPTGSGNFAILRRYCPTLQPLPGQPNQIHLSGGAECRSTIGGLTIREKVIYQPVSHFWFIQTVETAIFVGIAAVFVAIAVLAVTRRRPA